ncbi:hypothetical protein WJX74_006184 [Apatococcus lobatus]|uniref:RIIa domain-containing protein n=1 Tax=Apatococcus lobatus TaxID=904363 RepID=A0AAW1RL49_9CHLO
MAVQYRRNLTIPDGFPGILKSFTRETLRSQPENIYEFAAAYFAQQLQQAREQGTVQVGVPPPNTQAGRSLTSLYDQIFSRLQQQAANEEGVTALEARESLREVWKLFELPRMSADAAVGLARLNAEGCVDIISLASNGSQLLHELTSDSFKPMRDAALAAYTEAPLAALVCNVTPEDLEAILLASLDAACGEARALTLGQAQAAIAELAAGSLEMTLRDTTVLTAALMPGRGEERRSYNQMLLGYLVELLRESQKEGFVRDFLQAQDMA